ncbi:hypothetical protein IEQ34_018394 [Dendrobium chrysotoxum]|uniref:Uncharacterized protein n=1 Tax=Dendrobium chrysotoxum TaxID=161865 RepID=A0AAV7GEB7_DENCH|nr:hypothetical protein IEQ34_018394 [Dendrobium chrysotoxum]
MLQWFSLLWSSGETFLIMKQHSMFWHPETFIHSRTLIQTTTTSTVENDSYRMPFQPKTKKFASHRTNLEEKAFHYLLSRGDTKKKMKKISLGFENPK